MIIKSPQNQEVIVKLSPEDIKTLAAEIGAAVERALTFKPMAAKIGAHSFTNTDTIMIDETVVDISVSMDGIEKPEEVVLARTDVTDDNIQRTKNKLASLKNKDK